MCPQTTHSGRVYRFPEFPNLVSKFGTICPYVFNGMTEMRRPDIEACQHFLAGLRKFPYGRNGGIPGQEKHSMNISSNPKEKLCILSDKKNLRLFGFLRSRHHRGAAHDRGKECYKEKHHDNYRDYHGKDDGNGCACCRYLVNFPDTQHLKH